MLLPFGHHERVQHAINPNSDTELEIKVESLGWWHVELFHGDRKEEALQSTGGLTHRPFSLKERERAEVVLKPSLDTKHHRLIKAPLIWAEVHTMDPLFSRVCNS